MRYKLAIFDLDGTILNTLDDLHDSVNHALSMHGFPTRTKSEIRSFLGSGALNLITRSLPDNTDDAAIRTVFNDYIAHYHINCNNKSAPYDGIIDVLEKLRQSGIKTAVVSNKPDNSTKELCNLHFYGYFDSVIGDRAGVNKKPAPDSVIETMNTANCMPSETVYIGDSEIDILTAKNAGIDCISVLWGFRDADYLFSYGATSTADSPSQLFDIIAK